MQALNLWPGIYRDLVKKLRRSGAGIKYLYRRLPILQHGPFLQSLDSASRSFARGSAGCYKLVPETPELPAPGRHCRQDLIKWTEGENTRSRDYGIQARCTTSKLGTKSVLQQKTMQGKTEAHTGSRARSVSALRENKVAQ